MNIYDPKNKIFLWIIYGSLMIIFDKKKHIACITYYFLLITCPHIVCNT